MTNLHYVTASALKLLNVQLRYNRQHSFCYGMNVNTQLIYLEITGHSAPADFIKNSANIFWRQSEVESCFTVSSTLGLNYSNFQLRLHFERSINSHFRKSFIQVKRKPCRAYPLLPFHIACTWLKEKLLGIGYVLSYETKSGMKTSGRALVHWW